MSAARIIQGDCIEVMAALDENSVHAIVTDPPYGLEFMGKTWDTFRMDERSARWASRSGEAGGFGEIPSGAQLPNYGRRRSTSRCRTCGKRDAFRNPHACDDTDSADWLTEYVDDVPVEMRAFQNWCHSWAIEAYRVLKPGGHLLAFGGTRTYHRLAVALEDAGFDIRDSLHWIYGSGFPKSLDVSKQLDKSAGVERPDRVVGDYGSNEVFSATKSPINKGTPVTDAAREWDGWGTALKPAHEPVVMARKPLASNTVTGNLLEHGTGAINIAAVRVGTEGGTKGGPSNENWRAAGTNERPSVVDIETIDAGRWPSNVLLCHACYTVRRLRDNIPDGAAEAITAYFEGYALMPELRERLHGSESVGEGRPPKVLREGVQSSVAAYPDGREGTELREATLSGDEAADLEVAAGDGASRREDLAVEGRHVPLARVPLRPGERVARGRSPAGRADGEEERLRRGTSASDGEGDRETVDSSRVGASPERSQAGQPPGESDGGGVGGALATASESRTRGDSPASGARELEVLTQDIPDCWLIYFEQFAVIECEGVGPDHTDVLCADGCPVAELNTMSGESASQRAEMPLPVAPGDSRGEGHGDREASTVRGYEDVGGAARFFYIAKPRKREKIGGTIRNLHPTVKPVELMRYLVRMVTPPGGVVLDPFVGSGTTGCAAMVEGFRFIGIEQDPDSHETSLARISDYAFAQGRERPTAS